MELKIKSDKTHCSDYTLPAFIRLYRSDFVHVLLNGKIVKSGDALSFRARRKRIRLDQTRTGSIKVKTKVKVKRKVNGKISEEINLQKQEFLIKNFI
jgi:hypothetical protein